MAESAQQTDSAAPAPTPATPAPDTQSAQSAPAKSAPAKPATAKRQRTLRDRLLSALSILLIACGICIFAYPAVSNYASSRQHAEVVQHYEQAVSTLSADEAAQQLKLAQEYNDNLAGDPLHDPFVEGSGYALPENYMSVLNINGDGVMGYLNIPKISLRLPIYHGTGEDALAQGVGHMRQTALPIGGKGTRSVLSGHRGLPSAELFTRLDELTDGDIFTIDVLNETLAYKVVSVEVVEPEQINSITVDPNRDLVTLVTCTPYGVNTQRLLVTGERTTLAANDARMANATAIPNSLDWWAREGGLAVAGALLVAMLYGLIAWKRRRDKRRAGAAAAGAGVAGGAGAADTDSAGDADARDADHAADADAHTPSRT